MNAFFYSLGEKLYLLLTDCMGRWGFILYGGGGPSQQSVNQTNLPEYARPYFERLLNRTEAVSNDEYVPYQGPRVAGFNAAQKEAFNRIGTMREAPQIQQGSNAINAATNGAMRTTGFNPGTIREQYNPNQVQSNFAPGQFNNGAATAYMSPYQQQVTDVAAREADRRFAQQKNEMDGTAAKRGSFGGSRAALVKQEAQRGHNQQVADMYTKGNQEAFMNAQQQFERDRSAAFQATQQQLDAGKFNEASAQEKAKLNLTAQQQQEAARQKALELQQQGYRLAGDLGNSQVNVGKTAQELALQRAAALGAVGQQQQGLQQKMYDTAYTDFTNQRDFDRQQLAFYSGILRGVAPAGVGSDVTRTEPGPSTLSQVAGLGIAGLGAYGAMK